MTSAKCAWCGRTYPKTVPNRIYCDARCSDAARHHRKYGWGKPGVRPKRMLVNTWR